MLEVLIADDVRRHYRPQGRETYTTVAKKLEVSPTTVARAVAYLNLNRRERRYWK